MKKIPLAGMAWLLLLPFTIVLAHGDEGARVKLPDEDVIVDIAPRSGMASLRKSSSSLVRFIADNPSWQYRLNEYTGTFHRAWGEGIQIPDFHNITLLSAPQAANQFIEQQSSALGIRPAELRMLSSDMVNGKAYVKYIQTYNGVDVINAYVDLRISASGKVFMFGSDFHADLSVDMQPVVSMEAAKEFSKAGLDYRPSSDYVQGGKLFILPLHYAKGNEYRLVYQFQVYQNADETWETYVDAHSGAVLWRYNLVNFFAQRGSDGPKASASTVNGQVLINIYPQSYLMSAATVPAAYAYVNVGGNMYITDKDGRFTADIGGNPTAPVIARLSGLYSVARRADTSGNVKNALIQTTAIAGQDLTIEWNDQNSVASERNIFYHMTVVRNFIRSIDTSNKMIDVDKQILGLANINDSCNANWNGTRINFFKQSFRCGNTGEIADVIYHEYGHAINQFVYTRVRGSGLRNGTIGEATADITANMLLDDPRIGIGFMKTGPNDGIIRNSENTLRYPQNIVSEIHDDGMILTGAVWDMRKAIGLEVSRRLTHFAKYGTPDGTATGGAFADYFIEILVADDDDGNLANGTPHSADIIPAFIKHGIPASAITLSHVPLGDQQSVTTPYPISGNMYVDVAIRQGILKASKAAVVYSTDKWATSNRIDLTIDGSGSQFAGTIPAQKAGTIVRYYIEVTDNFGSVISDPPTAPAGEYLFLVGFTSMVLNECEVVDAWKVTGDALTGKWIDAIPVGTYNTSLGSPPDVPWVQTNADHTPGAGKEKCWVTGNAQASLGLGENDVDDGATMLTTRSYDVSSYKRPVLRYYRWYSNNSGASPGQDYWVVKISSDGGTTWTDLENTKESLAAWSAFVIPLQDVITPTDNVVVQFIASDYDPQSLVEAAVDDFEILDIDESLVNVEQTPGVANGLQLGQNYPNPVTAGSLGHTETAIQYGLPSPGDVQLRVYSAVGQIVRTLVSGYQNAGTYKARLDLHDLPSGTYVYELVFGAKRLVRQLILMK